MRNPGPRGSVTLPRGHTTSEVSELGLETQFCSSQGISVNVARQRGQQRLVGKTPSTHLVTCAPGYCKSRSGQDGPLRGPTKCRRFYPDALEAFLVGASRKPSPSLRKPTSPGHRLDPPRPEQVPGLSPGIQLVCPIYLLPCDSTLPGNPAVTQPVQLL